MHNHKTNTDFEHHSFLEQGKIQGAAKLILGSFPVYACTHAKPNQEFDDEGNLLFFYGSQYNDFWKYYSDHIDNEVSRLAGRRGIVASLERQKIAITDIILSCKRKGKSARDSDLLCREYNYKMLGEFPTPEPKSMYFKRCAGNVGTCDRKTILQREHSAINSIG